LPGSIGTKSAASAKLMAFEKYGLIVLYQCSWDSVDVIILPGIWSKIRSNFQQCDAQKILPEEIFLKYALKKDNFVMPLERRNLMPG
jgi:hypothetical protein